MTVHHVRSRTSGIDRLHAIALANVSRRWDIALIGPVLYEAVLAREPRADITVDDEHDDLRPEILDAIFHTVFGSQAGAPGA